MSREAGGVYPNDSVFKAHVRDDKRNTTKGLGPLNRPFMTTGLTISGHRFGLPPCSPPKLKSTSYQNHTRPDKKDRNPGKGKVRSRDTEVFRELAGDKSDSTESANKESTVPLGKRGKLRSQEISVEIRLSIGWRFSCPAAPRPRDHAPHCPTWSLTIESSLPGRPRQP